MKFIIRGKGHPNILATHSTTIEFTKEHHITKNGDCIVAVSCDKACADLPEEFKKKLNSGAKIKIKIEVNNTEEEVIACSSKKLMLTHPTDIVIRKSDFIDSRTLAIKANKAAKDLKRKLVRKLNNKNSRIKIILEVY